MNLPNRWSAASWTARRLPISPSVDRSGRGSERRGINDFLYDTDPDGLSCPLGAHIRRANPRTGDAPGGRRARSTISRHAWIDRARDRAPTSSTLPWPRNTTVWPFVRSEDERSHRPASIASCGAAGNMARRSTVRRRSNRGGKPEARRGCTSSASMRISRGNSNSSRAPGSPARNSPRLRGEQDPLLANREPYPSGVRPTISPAAPQGRDGFSQAPLPHRDGGAKTDRGCRNSVTVRGGAYFFLPGLTALKWIASDNWRRP